MNLLAICRVSYKALGKNRLRTALTMLGVIIGVGSVIAMLAVGQGAKASIQQSIAAIGSNMLVIFPGSVTSGGVRMGAGASSTLTMADMEAIRQESSAVGLVSPVKRGAAQAVYRDQNWFTSIQGVFPEYVQIRDWPLVAGEFFTQQDVDGGTSVVVLGQSVAKNLFAPGEDPVGQILRIRNIPLRIIGVLAAKGQSAFGHQDQDDTVLIPFTTAERRVVGSRFLGTVSSIVVSAVGPLQVTEAQKQITEVLRRRHRIQSEEDDFTVRSLEDIGATAQATASVMTLLLGSIASVSLLVGGIGIMNILLVSVTERTREIGVRMAVGARRRDILKQFLVEAIVLSTTGGLVGILLGVGVAKGISLWAKWPVFITPLSLVMSFGFSGAVGVFFGFYPARKAASLNPIDALRYE
ncbi:MAG: ABC transporter permease [Candidatus Tectomicrobia bacterium]|uniref:ABC transporter permease n=1 Tax=Tectimicrobiota bacterium TaxID=2528274 RepID=A0A932GQ65_UNCTE|nr:ABC transporter permease [Candidatus Tectomicrobia bacterium]